MKAQKTTSTHFTTTLQHASRKAQGWVTLLVVLYLVLYLSACAALNDGSQPTAPSSRQAPDAPGQPASPQSPGKLAFARNELAADIRPQDDFWGYVNARWIEQTAIPADRASYGTFHQINDRTEVQLRDIIDTTVRATADASATAAPSSGTGQDAQTLASLYGSFMDTSQIQARGLAPLHGLLSAINKISNTAQLAEQFGQLAAAGVTTPIAFYADNDATNSQRQILYLWQDGLGLPNRDYYLQEQAKLALARDQYRAHITNMFNLAGWQNGAEAATNIMHLEQKIAQLHWSQVQNRDRETIYSNQYNPSTAANLLDGFPLQAWFTGMGNMPTPDTLVLAQTSYFESLSELLANTPLRQWQQYLRFHTLSAFAPFLPAEIDNESFNFRGKQLRGQEQQAPRWKRGVRLLNSSVGELLGKFYVAAHFRPESKAQIRQLVENLRAAFADSIDKLEWMSSATKQQALAKLEAFLPKLGYPDQWRDYSALQLQADQLLANVLQVRAHNHAYRLHKLNQPVDRNDWTTNPQTVNAFYRPTHNSITFPAGILQSPMFDAGNDAAMNYGAIGSVIGHEFSHGFDDQGRKFDGAGLLRNWWTDADAEQYQARAEVLVAQYNNFLPLADTPINGELTLGENIGDLAGVTMAYRAFELSGQADGPSIAGLTPRQRFFIGYALAFRSKYREPYLRELLLRDPHSPGEYRVTGVLRNVPEFYQAFNVQPGDGMFLPAQQQAKIW